MKTLKIIGNCCCVFLAMIAVCVSIAFGYYHFFVKGTITGTNYIGEQVPIDLVEKSDELSDSEIEYYENRVLFTVNYYSNDKNNGIQLQEMKLDYFTDTTLSVNACRSTGMQYIGDFETYTKDVSGVEEADNRVVEDFYYYDTTNMISWSGGKVATQLNRNAKLIVKIEDKAYRLQLTKKEERYSQFLWWKWLSYAKYWDYGDVFYDVLTSVETNSKVYGDYYITLNLSDYFTVTSYDYETEEWKENNVADEVFTYALLKFHYDENGAKNSTQSMFGIIENNPKYNIVEDNIDTTYWQERMVYTLNEDDFNYRYSDVYKGYFVSLSMDTKKLFADMPRAKVNINIDLQSDYLIDKDINIVGIDYNGFENFEIDTLTITGEEQTIYLLDKSLFNTKLQTLKHSNGITFDIAENAVNNEYAEVVL